VSSRNLPEEEDDENLISERISLGGGSKVGTNANYLVSI